MSKLTLKALRIACDQPVVVETYRGNKFVVRPWSRFIRIVEESGKILRFPGNMREAVTMWNEIISKGDK